jgi:2-oxoisovalerate dehydrogenase E1 component alpha subunit
VTVVTQFEILYHQFLNPLGQTTQTLPEFAKDPSNLIHLYRTMVLVRVFDTKAVNLQRTGKLGTYASTLGQEAVTVGIGSALDPHDVFCAYYRDYGTQLLRGVKMSEILAYWGGDERGNNFSSAMAKEDFPFCVPIASQCLHAAGVACAMKLRHQNRATLVTLGDGATSEGEFYEAINLAGAWNLPLVFVVNNNQWAISVSRTVQTSAQTLAQKAIAGGFNGEQVDGNDIIAVRDRVEKALEKARNGHGPTLIEAITYRLCDHTTADDANRYRDKAELKKAWENDPVLRLRTYLMQNNAWTTTAEEELLAECSKQVEAAVQEYTSTAPQSIEDMFDYHYANMPTTLSEQKQMALGEGTE